MRLYQIKRWIFWVILFAVFFFGVLIGSSGKNSQPKYPAVPSIYDEVINVDNDFFRIWATQNFDLQALFMDLSKFDYSRLPIHLERQKAVTLQIKTLRIKREELLKKLGYKIPE